MNCLICKSITKNEVLKDYRYYICEACYSGSIRVIAAMTKNFNTSATQIPIPSVVNLPNSSEVFKECLSWIKKRKDKEEELKNKTAYLRGFVELFKQKIHTNIQLLPANNGSPIPAHLELLATRSNIFKNMLSSDGIMMEPANDTITFDELTYEELDCLVEFIYKGQLSKKKLKKHLYSLSIAAHKYDIPFLAKSCEKQLMKKLNSSNALRVLELSHTYSMQPLKELAMEFIDENRGEIVNSPKYEEFARTNPHLSLEITRLLVQNSKSKKRKRNT